MILNDKTALVTGASSGIGRHVSEALVARGARVYGLARSKGALDNLRKSLGHGFEPLVCDVTDADQVDAAFKRVDDAGPLDVLVNNAGLARFGAIGDVTLEDWKVQMDTNVRGVFLCARRAVPLMRAQNEEAGFGGHIVNIASIAGLLGNPSMTAYNASKFAVRGFSEALMKEVRDDGIRVSCIYPGSVETSFFDRAGVSMTDQPLQPEDVAATILHVVESPENHLISELVMRPLRPRG